MHRPQRIYTVRLIDGTFDGTKVLTSELFHFNGVFFASSFVIGNSSNGKVDWVLESDGKTPLKDFLE